MSDRLIPEAHRDLSAIGDFMMEIARNIEDGLRHSGAVPKKDYGYIDLCKRALPVVVEMWKQGSLEHTFEPGSFPPQKTNRS